MMRNELVKIERGIKKEQSLELLQDFRLTINAGELVFIVGGSVIEMDCISKLMVGEENLDSGLVFYCGKIMNANGDMSFLKTRTYSISEEVKLIDSISLVDNVFICSNKKQPFFAKDVENKKRLKELFENFQVGINVETPIKQLNLVDCYKIQLIKMYCYFADRIIVFDKRKSSLTEKETAEVYGFMSLLAKKGMTFVIIDYSISVFWQYVNRAVVIKDACTVMDIDSNFIGKKGKQILQKEELYSKGKLLTTGKEDAIMLNLIDLSSSYLKNINLLVHQGEIASIYYSDYKAVKDLYCLLQGKSAEYSGKIIIDQTDSTAKNIEERVKEGVLCIKNYIDKDSYYNNMSILDNYCFQKGMDFKDIWHKRKYKKYFTNYLVSVLGKDIAAKKCDDVTYNDLLWVKYLSIKLAKPKILVCLDPFSSVDVYMRQDVKKLLVDLANMGMTIVIISRIEETKKIGEFTQYLLVQKDQGKFTLV